MSVRLRHLAAFLAVLAFLPALPARAATPELPDRIATAWQTDRIFIDEGLRPAFPAGELARIRAEIRTVDFAVYVALVPRTPYTQGKLIDLPTLLQARVGQPGLYVVRVVSDAYWFGSEKLFRPAGLKGRDLVDVRFDDEQDKDIVDDRPAPKIVRTIQQAATAYDGRPLPAIPAGDLEAPYERRRGPSVTDQEDRSVFIGMGVGGLVGFAWTLTLVLRRRRRRPTTRKDSVEKPIDVPAMRLRADEWITRAEQALERLEKRRNSSVELLDQRDDAHRRLDAARTLRDGQPDDLLAVTGAFVLARQAERVAGGIQVLPPCFFDPTHRSGMTQVTWSDDIEVPACQQCAQTLGRGATPRGLQVWKKSGLLGLDRRPVPYWTLDPEESPMVETGFGALSDDLAERVAQVYGGVR